MGFAANGELKANPEKWKKQSETRREIVVQVFAGVCTHSKSIDVCELGVWGQAINSTWAAVGGGLVRWAGGNA